jgi:hypothetical protein
MTQDNWQDFDRQVRSMLQDAEVKAPRRVWRAVSGRLDAAAARWKWAVPAFAFAAIAAGLFFTWNGKDSTAVPQDLVAEVVNTSETVAPVAEADVVPAAEVMEELAEPVAPVRRAVSVAVKPAVESAAQAAAGQEVAPAATEIAAEEAPAEAAPAEAAAQPASANEPQGSVYSESEATKWADIEKEARRIQRLRLTGFYAQGGVGGNDSNITYGGTGISQMAPGPGSADAGISESSTSTYGIPFTLGLGTRFHIGDRFALGTGLEYSLLTRTFKGTYSDNYAGSIYHAVQYVGVPVNAYYDLLSASDGLLNLYAWGGGAAEVCVSNQYRLLSEPGLTVKDKAGTLQFSVALGIGVEIPLSGKLSLYLDPAVRYYFHGNQPKSLRTDKPFMFNMDAGLRFNL